eukprot:CAMPEP_0172644358 /NCGR_PEP_ID=MMETSP1068-20121228/239166_1 /TAXON_ID=35684 /ORGANISM="Pseudopedinella elastica, Strain CCMP716" /LENGTH=273 /DNA_ID=CAMNT_0013458551 /DNA_START=454 /DNA_END=1275 /DNA_ORIENTATION=-
MPKSFQNLVAFAALSTAAAFAPALASRAMSVVMRAQNAEGLDRRQAMGSALAGASAALGLLSAPGSALALGQDKFKNEMLSYGVKDTKPCPDGFNPVIEFYGKAISGVDPLLVTFNSPNGWLLVRPNIDNNGEDGTISTGDYGKGDSCSFFLGEPLKSGESLDDRALVEKIVFAGLTTKGASQVQGFKMKAPKKLEAATLQPYYLVEYTYTLLTGAGFEINRRGCGSVTATGGKNTQALLGASTDIRWKKVEGQLHECAESFRVYDGKKPPLA